MNILLLTSAPGKDGGFAGRLSDLENYITSRGDVLVRYELSEMDIHFCTGCFNCWWKTPGRCTFRDDMEVLYPEVLKSDLLVFASPLAEGLPSWRLKQVQDRLVPLVLPYIELVGGECHHKKRYNRYPDIALVVQKEEDTAAEDLEMIKTLHRRLAINFHSTFRGIGCTDMTNEEIYHETCAV